MGRCQMQQNEAEKARVTMERALQANKSKDHISIVQKFARLEFELGDVEKGKTIFEQTIKVEFYDLKSNQIRAIVVSLKSIHVLAISETRGRMVSVCRFANEI